MFGVKERQVVDQSANFFNEPQELSAFRNISSILIVDEDRDVLNQLSQSFAICAKQYNICTVRNSMDALKALKTTSVKILLTALNMPMMHDFDLLDYTRKYYPATRIFAMSEEEPSAIKKRLDDLGIYGYIKKPFRIEMIYSILRV